MERVNTDPQVVAAVSFLNMRPLIDALDADPAIRLVRAVPSRLAGLLRGRQARCAMLPVIDLQRLGTPMRILPAGCISSFGETFTVRVFSRVAPQDIRRLVVDTDSHTSVALAAVLWAELFGRQLDLVPATAAHDAEPPPAMLMIGDKVVTHAPKDYPHHVDLGEAWRTLTGLPFVFAVWAALADAPAEGLPELGRSLRRAREAAEGRLAEIARTAGPQHGWPVALAEKYLTQNMRYDFGAAERSGMEHFFHLAQKHALIDRQPVIEYIEPTP